MQQLKEPPLKLTILSEGVFIQELLDQENFEGHNLFTNLVRQDEEEQRYLAEEEIENSERRNITMRSLQIKEAIVYGKETQLIIKEAIGGKKKDMRTEAQKMKERWSLYEQADREMRELEGFIQLPFERNKYDYYCALICSKYTIDTNGTSISFKDYYDKWGENRTIRAVNMAFDITNARNVDSIEKREYNKGEKKNLKPPIFLHTIKGINHFRVKTQTGSRSVTGEKNVYFVAIDTKGNKTTCTCDDQKINASVEENDGTQKRNIKVRLNNGEKITIIKNNERKGLVCKHIRLCYLYQKLNNTKLNTIGSESLASTLSTLLKCDVDTNGIPSCIKGKEKEWRTLFYKFPSTCLEMYKGNLITSNEYNRLYPYLVRFNVSEEQFIKIIMNWGGWNKIQGGFILFSKLKELFRPLSSIKNKKRVSPSFYFSNKGAQSASSSSSFLYDYEWIVPEIETPSLNYFKNNQTFYAQIIRVSKKTSTFSCTCKEHVLQNILCIHMIAFYFFAKHKLWNIHNYLLFFIENKYTKLDPIKISPFEYDLRSSSLSLQVYLKEKKYQKFQENQKFQDIYRTLNWENNYYSLIINVKNSSSFFIK